MPSDEQHTNRLAKESSPYLLQHAHNPVDWYPWGEEALGAAQRDAKPILLSVGYSACHWCHVMERESFENPEIAEVMNRHFINIKVDREERPDLDSIYMNFVQMTTGSGGWPLTVFLTPDQVPFFGGTYFPPEDSYGRPGFRSLLERVAQLYQSRREELVQNREALVGKLEEQVRPQQAQAPADEKLLDGLLSPLRQQWDPRHGGFGGAPKFPSAMALAFLLRYYRRKGTEVALEMVTVSLDEMARGGIYDQLGGGFHRYSVDERWLVPHFEKMLYDNALLVSLYVEAYQVTGRSLYRQVVEETLGYVKREMRDPAGGFYSSQDADSEGEEGKFYVWTPQEVEHVLGRAEAQVFNEYFDVTAAGNFEGKNILHHRVERDSYAGRLGCSAEELQERLDGSRGRLLQERCKRIAPRRDDKVLAAWNGMMLSAFAQAAFALDRPDFLEVALSCADFLFSQMFVQGRLRRTWKAGQVSSVGFLEDCALVIAGFLDIYQAAGEDVWLDRAQELMQLQLSQFADAEEEDFYFTPGDHEVLLIRSKEYFDNATPSGNSVSCLNLLRLAELLGEDEYRGRARRMLDRMTELLKRYPLGFGYWLCALDFRLGPVQEIAIVGPDDQRRELLRVIRGRFLPNKVVAVAEAVQESLGKKTPLLAGKQAIGGRATAYVCQNYSCREPVTNPQDLESQLQAQVSPQLRPFHRTGSAPRQEQG